VTPQNNNGNGGASSRSLIVKDLVKEYVPGKPVLKNISFEVSGCSTVAIIGPSGTGKSTLLRCINRLIDPTGGTITVAGHEISRLSGKNLRLARHHVGMVFQEFNLVERLSVIENHPRRRPLGRPASASGHRKGRHAEPGRDHGR